MSLVMFKELKIRVILKKLSHKTKFMKVRLLLLQQEPFTVSSMYRVRLNLIVGVFLIVQFVMELFSVMKTY